MFLRMAGAMAMVLRPSLAVQGPTFTQRRTLGLRCRWCMNLAGRGLRLALAGGCWGSERRGRRCGCSGRSHQQGQRENRGEQVLHGAISWHSRVAAWFPR
jgi:hypothetical protein